MSAPPPPSAAPDPLAVQMAQLLAGSDVDELREVVRRWVAEAPAGGSRRLYEQLGARLVELKSELSRAPAQPTQAELEHALTLMLHVAAQSGGRSSPR